MSNPKDHIAEQEAIQAHEAKVHDFLTQMAGFSLPEEEGIDVDDIDEERLFGEYAAFMEMVRWARSLT